MNVRAVALESQEPPAHRAISIASRLSQALLFLFCASPIAIFAVALAHRGLVYLLR